MLLLSFVRNESVLLRAAGALASTPLNSKKRGGAGLDLDFLRSPPTLEAGRGVFSFSSSSSSSSFSSSSSTSSEEEHLATAAAGGGANALEFVNFSSLGKHPDVHSPEWKLVVEQVRHVFVKGQAKGLSCFYAQLDPIVPAESVARGYSSLSAFHALDDRVKAKYHSSRSRINRGWVPLFEEPAYEEKVSYVEGFDLGMEVPEEKARGAPGIGPNVWPSPTEIPSFRRDVYGLYEELSQASSMLFKVFACALDLPPDEFEKHARSQRQRSVMRLLRYPPKQKDDRGDDDDDDDVGISAHTDFECFTLIHQSSQGLQVLARGEEGGPACWIDVPPYPTSSLSTGGGGGNPSSTFVVLIGDMLE